MDETIWLPGEEGRQGDKSSLRGGLWMDERMPCAAIKASKRLCSDTKIIIRAVGQHAICGAC